MLQDFKTFITRGNVVDMAVGIIIGAAFGAIGSTRYQREPVLLLQNSG